MKAENDFDRKQFVRKELDLHDITFANEARILSMLQRLKHPNILRLIGCYTHGSKHTLIFPFVEGGTLKALLDRPIPTYMCRKEMFRSIAGLASAISALHDFALDDSEPSLKGHHQDLNPDNILVDGSRFILADFGLSSIKDLASNSRTPFRGKRGYCQAPESTQLVPPFQDYEVTRAADIFALACIIVDLLVYLSKGPSGVTQFRDDREFTVGRMTFSLYHKGNQPHEVVTERLEKIAKEDASQSVRDVVHLIKQMLDISPDKRPKAATTTAKLIISTIGAFTEDILAQFTGLPPSLEVLIEKSRFMSWLACQDTNLFLSMPGAVSTYRMFESTIQLLCQTETALEAIDSEILDLDSRHLLDVRELNTQLLSMLPPDRRAASHSRLQSILFAELEHAGIVVTPTLESSFGSPRILQMAETKRLVAQVWDPIPPAEEPSFRTISSSQFTKARSGQMDQLDVAYVTHRQQSRATPMLRETLKYQDPFTGLKLLPRFNALCTLLSSKSLPDQLRTPPFFAFCHDKDSFCYSLLYEYPKTDDTKTYQVKPMCLRELLLEGVKSRYPSLETRLRLALDVAEALAAFHEVNWYHKDLTASNVLFFPRTDAFPSTRAQSPYLFGFQHSRDATDDFTQGPLQDKRHHKHHHPEYISMENHQFKRFIRQYDWYGLGILLIEIGFWQALEFIMIDHVNQSNEEFAMLLIQEKLPDLSFYMGTEYVEIVRYCLTCSDEAVRDNNYAVPLSASSHSPDLTFKHQIVFPLKSLVNRMPAKTAIEKREITAWDTKKRGVSKKRAMDDNV